MLLLAVLQVSFPRWVGLRSSLRVLVRVETKKRSALCQGMDRRRFKSDGGVRRVLGRGKGSKTLQQPVNGVHEDSGGGGDPR